MRICCWVRDGNDKIIYICVCVCICIHMEIMVERGLVKRSGCIKKRNGYQNKLEYLAMRTDLPQHMNK